MVRKNIFVVMFWVIGATAGAHPCWPTRIPPFVVPIDTFPAPPATRNLLFYVQRTSNINTIVYEVNTNTDGKLRTDDPVHIFWIRYAEDGQKEELNYVQRTFAYGLNFKAPVGGAYEFSFVSYKKLKMYLQYSEPDKRYVVVTQLGTKKVKISRLFVKINGGTFWVPKVVFIEIKGTDIATGKELIERFKP